MKRFGLILSVLILCAQSAPADSDVVVATKSYVDSIISVVSNQPDWNQSNMAAKDYIKNKPMLGTAAAANVADFATSAQGTIAETAVQPVALQNYATQSWVLAQGYSAGGSGGGGNTAALTTALTSHIDDHDNPHMVSKAQVGLGNVPNIDATNAANITAGVLSYARIPVGTTTGTVAAGDDARFAQIAAKANTADLGTAAWTNSAAYATAEQGAKADTALQSINVNPETIAGSGTSAAPYDLAPAVKTAVAKANTALQSVAAATGSGNVITEISASGDTIIVNKGITALQPSDIAEMEARLENIENLGFYLGTADTHSGLPTTVAALQATWGVNITPTVNDFADVLSDETRANANDSYRIVSVSGGNITWGNAPFRVYGQDVSGFMSKQPTAVLNNLAKFNAAGETIDSGKSATDFATAAQGAKADTAVQPEALTPLATKVYVDDAVAGSATIGSHLSDYNNPHQVSKAQVGLGNVQNIDTTNAANITSGTIGIARLPVGTTAGTVMAGDDSRISNAILTSGSFTSVGTYNFESAVMTVATAPLPTP